MQHENRKRIIDGLQLFTGETVSLLAKVKDGSRLVLSPAWNTFCKHPLALLKALGSFLLRHELRLSARLLVIADCPVFHTV